MESSSFSPLFSSSFSQCNSSAVTSKSTSPGQSVKDNSDDEDDSSRRKRVNNCTAHILKKCLIVDGKFHFSIYCIVLCYTNVFFSLYYDILYLVRFHSSAMCLISIRSYLSYCHNHNSNLEKKNLLNCESHQYSLSKLIHQLSFLRPTSSLPFISYLNFHCIFSTMCPSDTQSNSKMLAMVLRKRGELQSRQKE